MNNKPLTDSELNTYFDFLLQPEKPDEEPGNPNLFDMGEFLNDENQTEFCCPPSNSISMLDGDEEPFQPKFELVDLGEVFGQEGENGVAEEEEGPAVLAPVAVAPFAGPVLDVFVLNNAFKFVCQRQLKDNFFYHQRNALGEHFDEQKATCQFNNFFKKLKTEFPFLQLSKNAFPFGDCRAFCQGNQSITLISFEAILKEQSNRKDAVDCHFSRLVFGGFVLQQTGEDLVERLKLNTKKAAKRKTCNSDSSTNKKKK